MISSGVTFVERYSFTSFPVKSFWKGISGVGRPELPLLLGLKQGDSREAVGFLYCWLLGAGNQGFVKSILSLSWCDYSHHLPVIDVRFPGRRGEGDERVLVPRLRVPGLLLGGSVRCRGSGHSRVLPGMSNTTGGWSAHGMRQVAVASGRAAPISRWTAGRAAHGGVCAGPDLLLPEIQASL